MLHLADHFHDIAHIIPITDKPISRPRTCLTVASDGPAHCKLPVGQQGLKRISARRGQGRSEAEFGVTSGLEVWIKDFHCIPN